MRRPPQRPPIAHAPIVITVIAAMAVLVGSCGGDGAPAPLTVETTEGMVTGSLLGEAEDIRAFLGVPYAAPPTGAQRFLPPRAPEAHAETLEANSFGPSCQGLATVLDIFLLPQPPSEDCLSLNVWTSASRGRRPILVWFHGGGFVNGSSNSPIYDGERLARENDVVVVTVNYRLAAFGFLATDALDGERTADFSGAEAGFGNMGMLDMIQSLRWIRDNAAAFGGDPDNVTVFGESAGASAVCHLVAAEPAEGLLHRAIMQSGGCSMRSPRDANPGPLPNGMKDISDQLVEAVGCTDADPAMELACLRAASAQALTDAAQDLDRSGIGLAPFGPVVDGALFPDQNLDAFERGVGAGVPFIIGTNENESRIFNLTNSPPADVAALREFFAGRTGGSADDADTDALISLYGVSGDADVAVAWEQMLTDQGWGCRSETLGNAVAATGHPVYLFEFQHAVDIAADAFGATHGFEIPFVFNTVEAFRPFMASMGAAPREAQTATHMGQAWTSFARDGVPTLDASSWPELGASDEYLRLDESPNAESLTAFRGGRCETLRGLGLAN